MERQLPRRNHEEAKSLPWRCQRLQKNVPAACPMARHARGNHGKQRFDGDMPQGW